MTSYKLTFCIAALFAFHAWADPLEDEAQEARAQALFTQMRCMVCQGESISDSGSAEGIRDLVRNKVQLGKSDDEILTEIRQQFGDQIMMHPGWRTSTYLLWLAPILLFLIGISPLIRSKSKK